MLLEYMTAMQFESYLCLHTEKQLITNKSIISRKIKKKQQKYENIVCVCMKTVTIEHNDFKNSFI